MAASVCLLYNDFMLDLFSTSILYLPSNLLACFARIALFLSAIVCPSYPTEYILLRIKVQLLLSVYNTHIHSFLFSTTSTSMTLHCSVNIYIISIFAFAFLLCKFAFSRSLFVPVSFCPLMVLVSCYQGCLTAANLRAILALTLCKTQRLTTLILILYALTT